MLKLTNCFTVYSSVLIVSGNRVKSKNSHHWLAFLIAEFLPLARTTFHPQLPSLLSVNLKFHSFIYSPYLLPKYTYKSAHESSLFFIYFNFFIGYYAGEALTAGTDNVAMGYCNLPSSS